ncbi:MAG TPA: UbiA family prenyltransferase [Verrucomicrobiota bacterium]|nr:UbiA family prenyltransferase [Verrucomicrobiota bacterium]
MIMTLPSRLKATVALMRLREIVPFVLVTTLLGANIGGARPGLRLLAVLLGNLLAVAFAFMFNDVEDAPDDALTPAKAARNPISAGRLSPRAGYGASLAAAIGGLTLYTALGMWPLALGGVCLVLGLLYSWRRVRLKAIPVADLLSHVLMLAALQFLCAYTAFQSVGRPWLAPCLFVVVISMYGQLFNQLRDMDGDRQAGVNHTAARIGPRVTHLLMILLLLVALALLALSVWQGSIPLWTMRLAGGLSPLMLIVSVRRARLSGSVTGTHASFHEPVLLLSVGVLLAWLTVGASAG